VRKRGLRGLRIQLTKFKGLPLLENLEHGVSGQRNGGRRRGGTTYVAAAFARVCDIITIHGRVQILGRRLHRVLEWSRLRSTGKDRHTRLFCLALALDWHSLWHSLALARGGCTGVGGWSEHEGKE
jgi:hypothetical protein